jgi:hypothetical protein
MSDYIINGPLTIGDTGQQTQIKGNVKMTDYYGFFSRKTGTQTGITTTPTILTNWSASGSPEYNTTSGDFNTTTGVFTVSTTGLYSIDCNVSFTNTATTGDRILEIYNGSTAILQKSFQSSSSSSSVQQGNISGTITLNSGDTISVRIYRTATGSATITVNASPGTWFGVYRLSI